MIRSMKAGYDCRRTGSIPGGRIVVRRVCPPISVRKLAGERLDALEQALTRPMTDVNAAVHCARREIKKLRALLRLVRPLLGEESYALENTRLRDAARLLAPLRDAWVRLTLSETLGRELGGAVAGALEVATRHLRLSYEDTVREQSPEQLFPLVTQMLAPARARLAQWPEPGPEWIATGVTGCQTTFRQGRCRFQRALSNPTIVHLHELRKKCKDLRYQLDFLGSQNRNPFADLSASLHKLTDSLGKHNDLAMFRETAESALLGNLSQRRLICLHQTLESHHRATLDAAVDLGRRMFAAKPAAFAKRLERTWEQSTATGRKTGLVRD